MNDRNVYEFPGSDRVLEIDSDGAWHIGPGRGQVYLSPGPRQVIARPGQGQVIVTPGQGKAIVNRRGQSQVSSHLQLHKRAANRDARPITKGGVMTEEQPSISVADSKWAATILEESITTNPQVAAEASAVMEELLSGRLLERELTPTGLKEVAQQLVEAMAQAIADPKENHEN